MHFRLPFVIIFSFCIASAQARELEPTLFEQQVINLKNKAIALSQHQLSTSYNTELVQRQSLQKLRAEQRALKASKHYQVFLIAQQLEHALQVQLNRLEQDSSVMSQKLTSLPAKSTAIIQAKHQILESFKAYATAPLISEVVDMMPGCSLNQYTSRILSSWINQQQYRLAVHSDVDAITTPKIEATKEHLQELITHKIELERQQLLHDKKMEIKLATEFLNREIGRLECELSWQVKRAGLLIRSDLAQLKKQLALMKKLEADVYTQARIEEYAYAKERKQEMVLAQQTLRVKNQLQAIKQYQTIIFANRDQLTDSLETIDQLLNKQEQKLDMTQSKT